MITGGAGFIGSNFTRYWVRTHPSDTLVVFDALTYAGSMSSLAGVEDAIEFVEGDICDQRSVSEALIGFGIDVVINFAAESHNSLAIVDPGRFFSTNVMGTQNLLEESRKAKVQRFHHISTCEVYGDLSLESTESFSESSPYLPRTPYNASKAGADHAVRAYYETFELPVTITNCCNNYGPYQFPEKVIPLFATNGLDKISLPVYASSANRREWLHVDDHCSAIATVLEDGEIGSTYNVGSGYEASITQIADSILDCLGAPDDLKMTVPDRPGHDRRYLLDSTKIRSSLGWSPNIDFEEGLSSTVEWYRNNRSWWEPLKLRAQVDEKSWTTVGH
ncbi:MAG TPA: dTDP-glucose 4,6-dehydratase [Acidimicrobiales bacterium]|nr:dTDP-glucose 4,6-dehydratase [Acidimicrobiales bacterium]